METCGIDTVQTEDRSSEQLHVISLVRVNRFSITLTPRCGLHSQPPHVRLERCTGPEIEERVFRDAQGPFTYERTWPLEPAQLPVRAWGLLLGPFHRCPSLASSTYMQQRMFTWPSNGWPKDPLGIASRLTLSSTKSLKTSSLRANRNTRTTVTVRPAEILRQLVGSCYTVRLIDS